MQMILVSGAAGKTGKAVIRALAARGERVHAYVHRQTYVAAVLECGAAVASVGPLDNVEAIIQAATGARAAYHICPNVSPHELPFARAVAQAAARAGVRRFVFHSVLHPQIEAMPHHWQKMRVEEMLFATNLDVTVLQPTAYMQNLLSQWDAITADGIYTIPYPAGSRISLVDLDDVAHVAAMVLTDDAHIGATYELAGTPPLSQTEVAEILGQALDQTIQIETETPEAWAARAGALDSYQRKTLTKMFRYYAQHSLIGNRNTLRWLLGGEPTSLADFVRRQA
jgi:NAD(P)H dehydrogenase (quinone)